MPQCEECGKNENGLISSQRNRGDKCKLVCKACMRWVNIWRNYGITREEYERMLSDQNHCCAICNKHESICPKPGPGSSNGLVIDHCHDSKKVRKLLCHRCNTIIGFCDESIETLRKAVGYLEEFRERK